MISQPTEFHCHTQNTERHNNEKNLPGRVFLALQSQRQYPSVESKRDLMTNVTGVTDSDSD